MPPDFNHLWGDFMEGVNVLGGRKIDHNTNNTKGAFGEFAGFYRWGAKRFDQADLKRYSRLKKSIG